MSVVGNVTAVMVVLIALLLGGVWSLSKGLWLAWGLARQKRNGCVVKGRVTRNVDVGGGGEDAAFVAEVEFLDARGDSMLIRSRLAIHPAQFEVGGHVLVVYESDRAREARIVQEVRSAALWLASVGGFFTLLAGLMLLGIWPS